MMKRIWKCATALLLSLVFILLPIGSAAEELPLTLAEADTETGETGLSFNCKSAILMEASTGTVLFAQNAEEALPPASVTKIMTLLLLMEAIDEGRLSLEDTVTVSANAASMGGSQVYLKEGEQMKLEDLLKSVVIASANDAAVALAEHLWGSVAVFVAKMNERAESMGMKNTHFDNVTGLDDTATNHVTSAMDIAIMSRELISHPTILKYSSIWMDTIRDGAFGLTNTNRLVRFYRGCTGLKTGSTSKAGFCISVTAERDGMSLICVIMGAESRDIRNEAAASLLDWGFAGYGVYTAEPLETSVLVTGGAKDECRVRCEGFSCVLPKNELKSVTETTVLPASVAAPICENQTVGERIFSVGGRELARLPVQVSEPVLRISFFEIFTRLLASFALI